MGGGRRNDDMLVEVDLSAIVADMEDGEGDDVGHHHVGGGVGSDFMNMVSKEGSRCFDRARVRVCFSFFVFGIDRANLLTSERASVVAGKPRAQHAFQSGLVE